MADFQLPALLTSVPVIENAMDLEVKAKVKICAHSHQHNEFGDSDADAEVVAEIEST